MWVILMQYYLIYQRNLKEKEDGCFSITHTGKHSQGIQRKALNGKLHVLCNVNNTSKHQNLNSVKSEVPD